VIEKRLIQWYASDAGVDLDVAEREVVLTYVLRILADAGLLQQLAFKGGTAIRKLHLGNQGRFSLDLDFTAVSALDPEATILEFVGALHDQTVHGLTFSIPSSDYYANPDSCGAVISYSHAWVTDGRFGLQISFRDPPLLPLRSVPLRPERYFEWLGFPVLEVPALDFHEILGEKIRAASQRSRVRDLYDLYQLASHRFDRDLARRMAVLKCWETRWKFDPGTFLAGLSEANYDWMDLRRLVRRSGAISPDAIIQGVRGGYAFLAPLSGDEALLASDTHGRERRAYSRLVSQLPGHPGSPT
jgi:predicted nucleotidyltransferase component of viral defense system